MTAGLGVILVCLVSGVKLLSLLNLENPSVTTFIVENSNLFASNVNLRKLLTSNVYKHRKKAKELEKKLKKKKSNELQPPEKEEKT